MTRFGEYEAVVFDMDGVLIERSPAWVFDEATQGAFDTFDIDPEEEDYESLRYLSWVNEDGGGDHLRDRYGVGVESLWAVRESLASINQIRAIERGEKTLYPDAMETVDAIDLPMGVVSNNSQQAVEHILRRFGFSERFRSWYGLQPTLDDAARSKPNPSYLRRVLSDLDAETGVYVGDRASDVAAAHAAGIDSAFVHREFNTEEEFDEPPTYELDRLGELPAKMAGAEIEADGGSEGA